MAWCRAARRGVAWRDAACVRAFTCVHVCVRTQDCLCNHARECNGAIVLACVRPCVHLKVRDTHATPPSSDHLRKVEEFLKHLENLIPQLMSDGTPSRDMALIMMWMEASAQKSSPAAFTQKVGATVATDRAGAAGATRSLGAVVISGETGNSVQRRASAVEYE